MNILWVVVLSVFTVFLLISTGKAMAEIKTRPADGLEQTSGWHGYIQLLTGGFSSEGLAKEGDDNQEIPSVEAKAIRFEEDFILPLWQVNYHFKQSDTTLSFGTPDHGIIENDLAIGVGISQELTDGTTLWASYAPKLSEFHSEVWQDSYLAGVKRERTKTALESISLGAEYLFDTPLSVAYHYGELSIDHDEEGDSLASRLTPKEIKQLQRGKKFHHAQASLTLPLTENFFLVPGASYTRTDARGEANCHDSGEYNLTVAYQNDNFEVFAYGYLGDAKFDELNPVFRKKRKDKRYGITTGISYLKPFGWKNIKLDLMVGESQQNSNIHFFDSREAFLAAGLTYEY